MVTYTNVGWLSVLRSLPHPAYVEIGGHQFYCETNGRRLQHNLKHYSLSVLAVILDQRRVADMTFLCRYCIAQFILLSIFLNDHCLPELYKGPIQQYYSLCCVKDLQVRSKLQEHCVCFFFIFVHYGVGFFSFKCNL
jgi:hypothetical protein